MWYFIASVLRNLRLVRLVRQRNFSEQSQLITLKVVGSCHLVCVSLYNEQGTQLIP